MQLVSYKTTQSVKTAFVYIVFFFSLFQILWSNYFFQAEIKEYTLYLKHEIILYQKEKRRLR